MARYGTSAGRVGGGLCEGHGGMVMVANERNLGPVGHHDEEG